VELTGVATDKAHAVAHAKHVFDKARLRELIEAASELLTEAYRGAKDVDEIIAHARARLDDLVPETA
jgi:replicative DNA helicase